MLALVGWADIVILITMVIFTKGILHMTDANTQPLPYKGQPSIRIYISCAWLLVVTGLAIAAWGVTRYFVIGPEGGFTLNLLGDFLAGAVSSVWALAGLFFIYVAFLGQKQQLRNQEIEIELNRKELENTRQEIAGQRQEMAAQNLTMSQQRFENTFFQLLANHGRILGEFDLHNKEGTEVRGRDCFVAWYDMLRERAHNRGPKTPLGVRETIVQYEALFHTYASDLGHYFRSLYHMIKFVEESDIPDQKRYTNFVRMQLSSHELALLFYNCLSQYGVEKFKPLVEQFSLLKNLDPGLVLGPGHRDEYGAGAFSA